MVFLSHNVNDKVLVEPIALRLRNILGQSNVFYDSWSIQPGDGIIDKMSEGLRDCEFFFFFISNNSLNSKMVKLEWQNALHKSLSSTIKFIPIRLDNSEIPFIIADKLYLDLYTNGIEVVLRQIVDIISKRNIYNPSNYYVQNLTASVIKINNSLDVKICITAKYYMEPISHYAVMLKNNKEDVEIYVLDRGMISCGYKDNVTLSNGLSGNVWLNCVSESTVPGFPFEISIKSKLGKIIEIVAVLHETSKNNWKTIDLIRK